MQTRTWSCEVVQQRHGAGRTLCLRYSHLQKGYQCYSSNLRYYIVSADVSFYETRHLFP
ncbi:hypothetical protein MTR_4g051540 [Medicago truncatula]|uniref:Uncharacterized protein n=1 Tax=Medicago truncatula TaxID=3880 RepID=G7JSY4_MEDTR|nr:hypothetical protein MTR_4g051540 [Medicago truncatula]